MIDGNNKSAWQQVLGIDMKLNDYIGLKVDALQATAIYAEESVFHYWLGIAYVHEKVSGHLCTQCGKNFKIKSSLRDHILVVHEGKKYHCDCIYMSFSYICVIFLFFTIK